MTDESNMGRFRHCLSNLDSVCGPDTGVFLTPQSCMVKVMKIVGRNNCKLPHMVRQYCSVRVVDQIVWNVIY